jgi:hypothetical protein
MNNEPVAWIYKRNDGVKFLNWKTWKDCETCNGEFIPLYTAPQGDGCGNCHACLVGVIENHMPVTSQRMIVCSDCGNKRCPKASNHRHQCTGSNEVGQYGSIYTAPRELSDEEIEELQAEHTEKGHFADTLNVKEFARAILKKASEK